MPMNAIATNTTERRRGRPREFNHAIALGKMTLALMANGIDGTSLDLLSNASGLKRPSIRLAFGEKADIIYAAISHYRKTIKWALEPLSDKLLDQALRQTFGRLVSVFSAAGSPTNGCLLLLVMASAFVAKPKIRGAVNEAIREMTEAFECRFRLSNDEAKLSLSPEILAEMSVAIAQLVATKARAGASRGSLLRITDEFSRHVAAHCQESRIRM